MRWVLAPAVDPGMPTCVCPQAEARVERRRYAVDYEIRAPRTSWPSSSTASSSTGAATRSPTTGCGRTISCDRPHRRPVLLRLHPPRHGSLRRAAPGGAASRPVVGHIARHRPSGRGSGDGPGSAEALRPSPAIPERCPRWRHVTAYFDSVRGKLNHSTLRDCQTEAFAALANYYGRRGRRLASCPSAPARPRLGSWPVSPSPGAGPWWSRRGASSAARSTGRSTMRRCATSSMGCPVGPLIPGCRRPRCCTLDRDEAPIKGCHPRATAGRRRHRHELPLSRHRRRP